MVITEENSDVTSNNSKWSNQYSFAQSKFVEEEDKNSDKSAGSIMSKVMGKKRRKRKKRSDLTEVIKEDQEVYIF